MADISKLSRLLSGVQRQVDLASNTLVLLSVKVGGGVSNTELTKAILDRLVSLQNGTDVDATYHTHDGRYFTKTELGSATASSGSDLIGDDATYTNFTPAAATVKGALSGIDSALGAISSSGSFSDSVFQVTDNVDPTKIIKLEASAITAATTRTITMADANVNLADVNNAVLVDGSRAFTANQSMGSNKLTSVADPVSAQDAATKAYVDSVAQGLKPKAAVRAASLTNMNIATSLQNGNGLDGVALVTGDRILLKDQTAPAENGIYIVQAAGAAVRSTDFDSLSPIDEINGAYTFIQEGTQAGQGWVQSGTVATIGTDPIVFVYFNSLAGIVGGDMVTVTGSTISVDLAATSGLESSNPGNSAGQLRVKLEASNPSLQINGSNELGAKLDAAGAIASGASGLSAQVDGSTIEINTNALRVKDAGITLQKLASNSVDENKIASTALGSGLAGGSGTVLSVVSSPLVSKTLVAGEAFSADVSYAVRWGMNSLAEDATKVYSADLDATSNDKFWVIGIAKSVAGVAANGNISVVMLGSAAQGANDTAFNAADIGAPVWLSASGTLTVTAPTTASHAVFKVGIVESTTPVWVDRQMMGIN